MRKSRDIALSGVFTALALVLMWIGALSGIGTYAAPLLAGIALVPVGLSLGVRYQWLSFAAVSLLSCFLSADWEQSLMFFGLFGWYPIVRPLFGRLRQPMKAVCKLCLFNLMAIGIELLFMQLIAPQAEKSWVLLTLLLLGNVLFLVYDRLLPRVELLLIRRLRITGPSER